MYKVLDGITSPNNEDTLWRYMSFEKFVSILETESLFYTKAYKFEDTLEGVRPQLVTDSHKKLLSSPEAHTQGVIKILEIWRKHVMCNCWHQNEEESKAMWDNYGVNNDSIAIKTTVRKMKDSLSDTMFDVFIGKIKYLSQRTYDEHYILDFLKSRENGSLLDLYKNWTYFPYFYKRKKFEYEHEVRIIIDIDRYIEYVLNKYPPGTISDPEIIESMFPDSGENGKLYRVNVNMLIDKIITSPCVGERIAQKVKSAVQEYGYNFEVNPSTFQNL